MKALVSIAVAALALVGATLAHAQSDAKACVVLLMHGKGGSPQQVAALASRLRPACLVRAPDMPWSAKRGEGAGEATDEIRKHVKELRAQNFKHVLLAGQGLAANAAMAYAGKVGDIEGVVAIGAADEPGLPAIASGIKQHVPLLWIVSAGDPLHAKGEPYAYAKAPPHPASRYVALKAANAQLAEASAKSLLDFAKSLD